MNMKTFRILISSLLAVWLAASARADRVELADGSIINGKILSAEGGKLKVETAFAGTIEIAQDKVKTFATDEAVNVSLAGGSAVCAPEADAVGDGLWRAVSPARSADPRGCPTPPRSRRTPRRCRSRASSGPGPYARPGPLPGSR